MPDGSDYSKDYLVRLRVLQTPLFGIMVHRINGPDARAVLHNHPFPFISFVIKGKGYTEYVPGPGGSPESTAPYAIPRRIRRVNVKRFNNSFHWINEVHGDHTYTLVFTGRRRRVWGYLEKDGTFVPFNLHPNNDVFHEALEARGGGDQV